MSDTEQEYVLGTDDDELQRLGFQHQVWAEQTAQLWRRAGFAPGQRVLDLGCGPGYATADLAQLVGADGAVYAVDVSRRFLSALERLIAARHLHNVQTFVQDAATLSLPATGLDGAFARWVLSFTPDPAAVLARVRDALAPGARLAIFDYANYEAITLAPPSAVFDRVIAATGASVRDSGAASMSDGTCRRCCRPTAFSWSTSSRSCASRGLAKRSGRGRARSSPTSCRCSKRVGSSPRRTPRNSARCGQSVRPIRARSS
ncbi:MAG TPA: class I SAM-dependent methyltransferase [Gemmatimonadaceae bacterium]|nr:class I SAM-dependent methyltransferase [Gemmatimonadaceae bacterium]